ncbi:MAG: BPSS1780 family membrane protein [Burkholderiaceae bacterium]
MEKPTAYLGWTWIRDGFAMFRKQPAELSTLFLAYLFLMLGIGIIPVLGQALPVLLVPVFSLGFLQACIHIEQGKRVYPSLVITGFRSPSFVTLLKLGVLYLIAALLAIAGSSIIDGGIFFKSMTGQIKLDTETVEASNMASAMMFAGLLYTPAAMALWFAAPLVAWQKMGVMKATFYSFFAVRRHIKAFLMYVLVWSALGIFLPVILSSILALFVGTGLATMLLLLPMSVVMTVVMYCSFYVSYVHVFGRPEFALPNEIK